MSDETRGRLLCPMRKRLYQTFEKEGETVNPREEFMPCLEEKCAWYAQSAAVQFGNGEKAEFGQCAIAFLSYLANIGRRA